MLCTLVSWVALLLPAWLPAPPPGLPTAVGMRGDEVLLGTERVLYREAGSGWSLVLTRGGVRDLASAADGTLIATAAGLYEWPSTSEAPQALLLSAGAQVRSVAIDDEGTAWVASDVGLFARARGERAFRRQAEIPTGAVQAVRALAGQVWVAARGTLWVREPGATFKPRLRGLDTGWWELNGAVRADSEALLAVPRGLWRVSETAVVPLELAVGNLHGLAFEHERIWVASERGLFVLDVNGSRPLHSTPGLDVEALAIEPAARGLLVATRGGIALLPEEGAREMGAALWRRRATSPDVRSVQRAALAYLELSPTRTARLEKRLRLSAFYPQVRTSLSLDRDRDRAWEHDQTFSSGSVRDLFDRDSGRSRGLGLDLQLTWELSRLADPGQALSISRERRQLIELRDQVLERVNRLYFERLRLLARLSALAPEQREEQGELELRVDELAAHLDAWTGGMFSKLAAGRARE